MLGSAFGITVYAVIIFMPQLPHIPREIQHNKMREEQKFTFYDENTLQLTKGTNDYASKDY